MSATGQALAVLGEALARPAAERGAFLDQACVGEAALRREVEALLAADAEAEGFLEPLIELDDERIGEQVGAWKLVRMLGRGGMGRVFLAERADGLYEARAAVKFLRFDLDDLRARFARERQFIAALDHPNIARLLDAGRDDHGAPFVVMEYVEGAPISEYCDHQRLNVRQRIELFLEVLDAVQTAHGHLIVHRDLKPANILVDASGRPKLLDFGIAKLLVEAEQEGLTRTGQAPLTPEYASPEQVRGEPVGTASDIYSLGVLLYELLTEEPPYRVTSSALAEIVRAVCETDPGVPSRVAREHDIRLGRDLDHVLLKALAKEPASRYATCAQLAEDLRRYLDGQPVLAVHAGWRYRLGKFLARHRLAAAVAALVAVALTGTTFYALLQAQTARRQAARAEAERQSTESLNEFLQELLAAPDPVAGQGRDVTVAELLDHAAETLEDRLGDDPETVAVMRRTLAYSYAELGLLDKAQIQARKAVAVLTAVPTADPEALPGARTVLGQILFTSGDLDGSREQYEQALAGLPDADSQLAATLESELGAVTSDQGDRDAAQGHYQRALTILESLDPVPNLEVALVMQNLATAHRARNEFEQALRLRRQVLSRLRRVDPVPRSFVARITVYLAGDLAATGDASGAEDAYLQAVDMLRDVYGPEHRETLKGQVRLASFYTDHGRFEDAAALSGGVWELARARLPSPHLVTADAGRVLGAALTELGQGDEAVPILQTVLEMRREMYPEEHFLIPNTECLLGNALAQNGERDRGIDLIRQALPRLEQALGPDDELTHRCQDRLDILL